MKQVIIPFKIYLLTQIKNRKSEEKGWGFKWHADLYIDGFRGIQFIDDGIFFFQEDILLFS